MLTQNSFELQIVNDLEHEFRLRYKADYFTRDGSLRCTSYVSDRQGNHYVTLKVSSNIN